MWLPVALVALFWAVYMIPTIVDLPIFAQFFTSVIATLVLTIVFGLWWLLTKKVTRSERLWGLAALLLGAVVAVAVSQQTLQTVGALLFGLPVTFTVWALWLVVGSLVSANVRTIGLVAVIALSWSSVALVRSDGLNGDLHANVKWRWAPKAEDLYLAERAAQSADTKTDEATTADVQPVLLGPGDWPALRGPTRDGVVTGLTIGTDWEKNPPEQLWKQRVGPAWSSFAIVGDHVYTQEQRGENEATVCLDPATGREIWAHEDVARFWDGQAGAGPRATPTFVDGKIYALGATGILNCLDAATGAALWSRNIVTDSAAPLPMWGYSSSPLVVDDVVVVYAGGPDQKGILAYRAGTGEPAWNVAAGPVSYGSAQLVNVAGQNQVLFLSDLGLVAIAPSTGELLWQHDAAANGIWRAVQPRLIGESGVLLGSEDLGLVRLELSKTGSAWSAEQRYASRSMKPAYNDFVVSDGIVYGFDGAIFCAVDAETGQRRWRAGRDARYGHGQLLLLADQHLLLVLSETGDVVLVEANPEKHVELARIHVFEGTTWNHPAIAHGRLFVRNGEEMACFELPSAEK
jgi:outer membrane protein assembly factor BamB